MNDIFKDMQAKVGCEYISDLPSYKRKVWQEMKRLNPADYEEKQLSRLQKHDRCCKAKADERPDVQTFIRGLSRILL